MPEEVRDDIDARLSEGEYVVPADVVRFFGVKFFEDLRSEAKMGLSNMEAEGRIGGEPVEVDDMSISEEDIAMLEQALTTGAADGGLMDKMATAAKMDPMINERMNAKGMSVGFAEGGMAQSLYNDPTRIDSIIDKVMVAAQANPSLMQELSKRGVSVNTTQADMQPQEMQSANRQSQGFAEGGATFNPMNYPLGFSAFGPEAGGVQDTNTIMVSYYNPTTNEQRQFAHYASSNLPVNPIPAGFIMGTAPATSAAEVAQASTISTGGNDDNDTPTTEAPDPNAWMKKYDYTDADALEKQVGAELDKEQGFLGAIFGAGLLGRAATASQISIHQTNIDLLKAAGKDTTDLETKLNAFKQERLPNPGGIAKWLSQSRADKVTELLGEEGNNTLFNADKSTNKKVDPISSTSTEPSAIAPVKTISPKARPTSESDDNSYSAPVTAKQAASTKDVTIKNRTDSSGKTAGQSGYKSALKEKQEATAAASEKQATIKAGQEAGKGYTGGYGFSKGGLMKRKKK
jgi:hypothetical protein